MIHDAQIFNSELLFDTVECTDKLQNMTATQVLISLGSNRDADTHLSYAQKIFNELGKVLSSECFINADFTATADQPKPDYTNQCVVVVFHASRLVVDFINECIKIEKACHRVRGLHLGQTQQSVGSLAIDSVTIDIDVLAIRTQKNGQWIGVHERQPLKLHELLGVRELITNHEANFR